MAMGMRAQVGPVVWFGRPRSVGHGFILGPTFFMIRWTIFLFAAILALCWWLIKLGYLSVLYAAMGIYRLTRQTTPRQQE